MFSTLSEQSFHGYKYLLAIVTLGEEKSKVGLLSLMRYEEIVYCGISVKGFFPNFLLKHVIAASLPKKIYDLLKDQAQIQ